MDKLSGHERGQASSSKQKQARSKRKPPKVVYIANPVNVKTSASDFRALVQELTGQHSNVVGHDQNVVQDVPEAVDPHGDAIRTLGSSFDTFDQVYSPSMIDHYSALTASSGLLYEVPRKKP